MLSFDECNSATVSQGLMYDKCEATFVGIAHRRTLQSGAIKTTYASTAELYGLTYFSPPACQSASSDLTWLAAPRQ
eukprot:6459753-Amphidinium_carterae.2